MRALARLGYGVAGWLANAGAALAPASDGKLARTLRARRGIASRYAAWGRSERDPSRPLLWMHAPSVGEGLQARPVLDLVRARRADIQLAYTFFSPSAESFASRLAVDFADYLPFDTDGDARIALDALRPSALVFSKLDVWPVLTAHAAERGVRLGLTSATLSAGSSRRGGIASALLREAYGRLDRVGAIAPDDAARLAELGVPRSRIEETGDVRYDQVWQRARTADRSVGMLARLASPRPTLVAGSTWPPDEAVLWEAWTTVRSRLPDARMIIAPHEPTGPHLESIERRAAAMGLAHARLDESAVASADVIVVARTGVLGDLYAMAQAAYVGGGFHAAGLHSVLEPAAFGAPVLFGPRSGNSRDAGLLLENGGGASVASSEAMAGVLTTWLGDVPARADAGRHARALVESGVGAAERTYALVIALVDGAPAR